MRKAGGASFHGAWSRRRLGQCLACRPLGALSPHRPLVHPTDREVGGKVPEWRGEGAWDEEPSRGERAKEEAGGGERARAGPGGAGRGAQGRRAEGRQPGRESARREEGGTARETGGADTASMCGTGWGLAHRSGVWQYYGMERP